MCASTGIAAVGRDARQVTAAAGILHRDCSCKAVTHRGSTVCLHRASPWRSAAATAGAASCTAWRASQALPIAIGESSVILLTLSLPPY